VVSDQWSVIGAFNAENWVTGAGKKRGACRCPASPSNLAKRKKPRRSEAFFFFYPIRSEYQIERINTPNIFEVIKMEVMCNEGQHFRTVSKKLDKFSTF
jgi:hypothetical protein